MSDREWWTDSPEAAGPGDRVPAEAYGDSDCPHMGHVDITFSLGAYGEVRIDVDLGGHAAGDPEREADMMRSAARALDEIVERFVAPSN